MVWTEERTKDIEVGENKGVKKAGIPELKKERK